MRKPKTARHLLTLFAVMLAATMLTVPMVFATDSAAADPAASSSSSPAEDSSASTPPAASSEAASDAGSSSDSAASAPTDNSAPADDDSSASVPADGTAAVQAAVEASGGVDIKTYFPEGEAPTIIDNSNGDGFTLQFYDAQGNEILPPDNPTVNSTVRVGFKLAIPESIRDELKKDDYYIIQLPDDFAIKTPLNNVPLIDPDSGQPFATFSVGTDGKITIVFTEAVQDYSLHNLKGNLYFTGGLNSSVIGEPGDHDVSIPDETTLPPAHITIRPATDSSVDKDGNFDREQNPNSITWTVDVNKTLDTLTGATVSDAFPSGLTFTGAEVYPVTLDVNGNVVSVSDTPAENATVGPDGTVTFDGTIDTAYRIVYHTDINEDAKPTAGGNLTFTNNATFTTNELGDLTAQSTLNARYGKMLDKKNAGYDPVGQIIHWNINYNYGENHVPQGEAWVDDLMDNKNVVVDPDSVVIRKVTFDAKGNPVLTNELLVEGVDYEIVQDTGENRTTFKFLHDIDYAVNITYDSKVTGIIDTDIPGVTNTATDGGGSPPTHGSTTIEQQGLIKRVSSVNYDTKTVVWTIDVNLNRYRMIDFTLTDTLHLQADQTLVSGSQKVVDLTDGGAELMLVNDITQDGYLVESPGPTLGFNGALVGKYRDTDHSFRITYETVYDIIHSDGDNTIRNLAGSNWYDVDGNQHNSSAEATFTPNQPDQDNGKKSGSYNAVTKEITWVVDLTYSAVNQPTLVSFVKRGDDNAPLSGVQFKLEKQSVDSETGWAPNDPDDTYVSGPDGAVEIRGLTPGVYRLVEITTEEGYVIGLPQVFTLSVGASGRVGPLEIGDIQNDDFYGQLIIHKTDESHFRHLAGATYSLYDGEDNLLRDDIVTDADGTAMVDLLPAGDYKLIETKGPEGYDIDHQTHAFSIVYDMQAIQVVTLNLSDPLLPETPYTPETPKTPPGTPTTETPPPGVTTVPQTGDPGDPAATAVLVASIIAIAAGAVLLWWALRRKKKPQTSEGGDGQ